MQNLLWLESHIGTMDDGIKIIDQFYWHITVKHEEDKWVVLAGEKAILMTDNREAVDAFLYGMGLAYSIFADEYVRRFREEYNFE